jgi:PucR C-terminal helix-turn-helix domain
MTAASTNAQDGSSGPAETASGAATVRHLVESVGVPLLRVLAAASGLDRRVRSTVLLDPLDRLGEDPDALLLMTGIKPDSAAAKELLRQAAARGYCGAVIKVRGRDISALIDESTKLGFCLLAAADEVSWQHLDALLLSVLGSQGVAEESAAGIGDELFALANAIAAVFGGSVAIEDLDRRVLAYSTLPDQRIDSLREQSILNRRVPNLERNLFEYRTVLASNGVVRFPEKVDEFARSAIAIKAGQPLGTIWAIEGIDGVTSDGEDALIDGAKLAALKILRELNATGIDLSLREAALLRALDGALGPTEVAFRLSLPGGTELTLVGFAALPDANGSTPLITHVSRVLARYLAAYRPDAALATTSRAVYVLLPGGSEPAATRFAAGALTATLKAFPHQVRAAVAYVSADATELPGMRSEIDDILRVTTVQLDLPTVARLSEVHTRVLLAHLADELVHVPRLRHPGVDKMIAYDQQHDTEYGRSVTAWLDAVGGVTDAAASLGVHPNTLRYRLRRVQEMFDVSLDHPDDRLSVWLHLRLARPDARRIGQ